VKNWHPIQTPKHNPLSHIFLPKHLVSASSWLLTISIHLIRIYQIRQYTSYTLTPLEQTYAYLTHNNSSLPLATLFSIASMIPSPQTPALAINTCTFLQPLAHVPYIHQTPHNSVPNNIIHVARSQQPLPHLRPSLCDGSALYYHAHAAPRYRNLSENR